MYRVCEAEKESKKQNIFETVVNIRNHSARYLQDNRDLQADIQLFL